MNKVYVQRKDLLLFDAGVYKLFIGDCPVYGGVVDILLTVYRAYERFIKNCFLVIYFVFLWKNFNRRNVKCYTK